MSRNDHPITQCVYRWRRDLQEVIGKRSWQSDFSGEIDSQDVHYSIFLVVLSLVPAAIVAYTSSQVQIKIMANLFAAPMQTVITGFLGSTLVFLGSHVNQVAKPFPIAFKLTLRVMSIYPFLGFLMLFPYGKALSLLIFGFFVIRGVLRTYSIPLRNAVLFFGITYFVFALLQLSNP